MWLNILKVVAKYAVKLGVIDLASGWLRKKISGSADKAEDKANAYLEKIEEKVDNIIDELDKGEE